MLRMICESVLSDDKLKPQTLNGITTTYCNVAVQRIALGMSCDKFNAKMDANAMVALMKNSWRQVDGKLAYEMAMDDKLVIAGVAEARHGHVAVVFPEKMQYSGSWKKDVPMVANVGKHNGVMRTSQAFNIEPTYYCL